MRTLTVVAVAFVLMEAFTYCMHRWVMHGFAWVLHRSHHRRLASRFEANDAFPVIFSGLAMILYALAFKWVPLWPVCWGITVYGVAYLFVHDVYIHERLGKPGRHLRFLEPLKRAHEVHHRFGAEPYGMLAPVVRAGASRRQHADHR